MDVPHLLDVKAGALKKTAGALDNIVNTWIDIRAHYRKTMLDLTMPSYGRAKAAAKYMEGRVELALSRLEGRAVGEEGACRAGAEAPAEAREPE